MSDASDLYYLLFFWLNNYLLYKSALSVMQEYRRNIKNAIK